MKSGVPNRKVFRVVDRSLKIKALKSATQGTMPKDLQPGS